MCPPEKTKQINKTTLEDFMKIHKNIYICYFGERKKSTNVLGSWNKLWD